MAVISYPILEKTGVINLLELMSQQHLTPDVITLSAAISALGSQSEWHLALHVLQDMSGHHVMPNTVSFGAAMSACEKLAGKGEKRVSPSSYSRCRCRIDIMI